MILRILAALALSVPLSAAAVKLSPQQCQSLGEFAQGAAEVRDIGANRDKHIAYVMKANEGLPAEMEALLRKTMEAVHASKRSPAEIGQALFLQCMAAEGQIGDII
jgi:hypothetical protein